MTWNAHEIESNEQEAKHARLVCLCVRVRVRDCGEPRDCGKPVILVSQIDLLNHGPS